MVVFACNACGESLKKNQVENHYLRKCRNCDCLSCLDCGKDFWGNDYEQHTKCITEEEKYSGKNFVPKPGSNKNEIKQQQWLQQVQDAVDKCNTNPRLKSVLIRLKDQPNVPRKKNKFVNFLANGFGVRDPNLANQVWDMLMANTEIKKQENVQSETNNSNNSKHNTADTNSSANTNGSNSVESNNVCDESTEVDTKKLSKREKKEERRKKSHKAEKKDKNTLVENESNVQQNGVTEKVSKKKSKKRKREEDEDEGEDNELDDDMENQSDREEDTEEPAKKKFKTKFNWNEIIVEVLQSKGPEMKIKKLRKKVLAEYLSQGCTEKSEEKLWSRFDKKLKKIPEVKITGEKVKLKNPS